MFPFLLPTKSNVKKVEELSSNIDLYTTPFKVKILKYTSTEPRIEGLGFAKNIQTNEWTIQNCIGTGLWYETQIGTEEEVLPFNTKYYRVNNNPGCGFYFIAKKDCKKI
jgi:hypothetical protein